MHLLILIKRKEQRKKNYLTDAPALRYSIGAPALVSTKSSGNRLEIAKHLHLIPIHQNMLDTEHCSNCECVYAVR